MRNSTVSPGFEVSKTPYHPLEKNCSDLYWLAFLITADQDKSVRAFTSAFEGSSVSQQLASSRTRERLVEASLGAIEFDLRKSALQTLWEQDLPEMDRLPTRFWLAAPAPAELRRAMLNIAVFPRCALVLTVFEHMHVHRASRLLHVDAELVRIGQRLGAIGLTRNLAANRGWIPALAPLNPKRPGTKLGIQVSR
jgi:hypothetical protein